MTFVDPEPISRAARRSISADAEVVLLKLETAKLRGRLVYEVNPGGTTKYYHLYEGSIPLEAVVEATEVSPKEC